MKAVTGDLSSLSFCEFSLQYINLGEFMTASQSAYPIMTSEELKEAIDSLRLVADIVRTVDVSMQREVIFDSNGRHINMTETCFDVWKKDSRCKNCISAVAFRNKTRLTKFEFIEDEIYHVISQYLEVDGSPYLLELVTKEQDDILKEIFGEDVSPSQIKTDLEVLYTDSVSGAANRSYYEEQLSGLVMDAVGMVRIKNYREITAVYGEEKSNRILWKIREVLHGMTRKEDAIVRYEEDQFLVIFADMKKGFLEKYLNRIQEGIRKLQFEDMLHFQLDLDVYGSDRRDRVREMVGEL